MNVHMKAYLYMCAGSKFMCLVSIFRILTSVLPKAKFIYVKDRTLYYYFNKSSSCLSVVFLVCHFLTHHQRSNLVVKTDSTDSFLKVACLKCFVPAPPLLQPPFFKVSCILWSCKEIIFYLMMVEIPISCTHKVLYNPDFLISSFYDQFLVIGVTES